MAAVVTRIQTIAISSISLGNFGEFCTHSADSSAESAAELAMGLPPPRLPM
jgi:hypothetical protein